MVKTRRWDSAELINTADDAVAYLNVVLEEQNPHALIHALGVVARSEGMTDIARRTGINRVSLYKALGDDGNPSFITIYKLLNALGIDIQFGVNKERKELALV